MDGAVAEYLNTEHPDMLGRKYTTWKICEKKGGVYVLGPPRSHNGQFVKRGSLDRDFRRLVKQVFPMLLNEHMPMDRYRTYRITGQGVQLLVTVATSDLKIKE